MRARDDRRGLPPARWRAPVTARSSPAARPWCRCWSMRLARPTLVIDINRIAALAGHRRSMTTASAIAAATRQADVLADATIQRTPAAADERAAAWSAIRKRAIAARSAAASPMPIPRPRSALSRARSMPRSRRGRAAASARSMMSEFCAGAMTTASVGRGMPDRRPLSGLGGASAIGTAFTK